MSLRNRPVRRGLVAGFAMAFFGSMLALGCVQGPKGAFNRVWGTDGVASKTAKSLKSLGRRGEKDLNEEKALAEKEKKAGKKTSKNGEILQASGENLDGNKKSGLAGRTWLTKPAQFASSLSNGIVAAPFVQKRQPKNDNVQDPFLSEFARTDIAKATPTKKPSTISPVAASASRPINSFAPGFDAQMAQLKADVAREKMASTAALATAKVPTQPKAMVASRPKVEAPKTVESPELVATRLEVAALLKQARAADQHGQLDRAMELALSADNLASVRGLHLRPDENRPEDMLQHLREEKFSVESGSKLAALMKPSPKSPNTAEVALAQTGRVEVVADDVDRDARRGTVRQANEFGAELADEFSPGATSVRRLEVPAADPIAVQRKAANSVRHGSPNVGRHAQPNTLAGLLPEGGWQPAEIEDRAPAPRSAPNPVVVASATWPADQDMIVESKIVPWRFPPRPRQTVAMLDRAAFNLADTSRTHDMSKPAISMTSQIPAPVKQERDIAKVSANSGTRLATSTGRVKSNHAAVVPASGQTQSARSNRRDLRVASTTSHGILQTSANSAARDGGATLSKWQSSPTPAAKQSEKPGLLKAAAEEQQAIEAAPVSNDEISNDRAKSSAASKRSLHDRSFLTGLGIAVAFVIGVAFWRRLRNAESRT